MINHNHNFIFIHIPKTGGSSIEKLFLKKYINGGLNTKHKTINSFKRNLEEATFKNYFKFCCIRNPWERMVSYYHFRARDENQKGFQKRYKNFTFKQYLLSLKKGSLPTLNQSKWIFGQKKQEGILVDYVMKFENLQSDFNIVCDKIGVQRQELEHVNKTNHGKYQEYYTEETKEIVDAMYKKDIERLGYNF